MPLAGAGYGAAQALHEVMAQQMLEQQAKRQAQESAARLAMQQEQQAAALKQQEFANNRALAADRERANNAGVRRMIGEFLTQREGPLSPGDARAVAAMQIEAGDSPNMASLLPKPEVAPRRTVVTTIGPKNEPIKQSFTDDELAAGVPEYREPAKTGSSEPRPLTQTAEAQIIQKLSGQWTTAQKPIKDLDRQVALMDEGMKAVRNGDLAQGAQTVLVTFQKILDPPSVVRESEYMRSASGQSLMNRIKGAFQQLQQGGAGISPDQLQKFADLARQAAAAQRKASGIDGVRSRLSKTAQRYNIPEELIFSDMPEADASSSSSESSFSGESYPEGTMQKPIPGINGAIAESRDGGKTWKRVK